MNCRGVSSFKKKLEYNGLAGSISFALALMCIAVPAAAQNSGGAAANPADIEARMKMLEQSLAELKQELARAKAAEKPAHPIMVPAAAVALARDTKQAVPSEDGFQVGETQFRMGGFVKAVASASRYNNGDVAGGSAIREFYLPQQIPVGNGPSTHDVIGHARQTRLFFDAVTPAGGREIKAHVEFDFALASAPAGAQRSTNAYTPAFRRGFFTYGHWLIGQEWSNFQNPALFPESTDFVGPTEGVIFVRQMQVRYTHGFGGGLVASLSFENPQTEALPTSSTNGAAVDTDNDRFPDVTAMLAYKTPMMEWHISGLMRTLNLRTVIGNERYSDSAIGWGVNLGGKTRFGPNGRHDFILSMTYGRGISRYLGLGSAADAVYTATAHLGVEEKLRPVENFAGLAGLKIGWTPKLRSTVMAGYQHTGYPNAVLVPAIVNKEMWSGAVNLFWSPVSHIDFGVEYRRGERTIVSGDSGRLDRVEMSAKYSF